MKEITQPLMKKGVFSVDTLFILCILNRAPRK